MNPKPCHAQLSQFELCKQIYTSGLFNKIKLTPTSKLVIIALANHYNPEKPEMFPSQEYLSKKLGISLNSVKNAVKELREKSLILSELKRSNHYRFSNIFFEMTNSVPRESKNCAFGGQKFVPEQKHEHVTNMRFFKKTDNFSGSQESKQIEATRRLINETFNIDTKSPMDDLETAKKWLSALTEEELKHSFIKERVVKIKTHWKL